jgi:hypothetical protein
MTTPVVWLPVPALDSPAARCNHASAVACGSLFVYGGWHSAHAAPLRDLHRFDVLRRQWHVLSASEGVPASARCEHTLTCVGDELLVAFGGVDSGRYLQDLQLVNVVSGVWSNVFVQGEAPPARAKHTATALSERTRLLLFGGGDAVRLFNDVWLFDASTSAWSRPRVRGPPPTARCGHTAVRCGDLLVVHGGWNGRSRLSDVHMLDTRNMCWVFMASLMGAADAKLSAVMGHAAVPLSDKLMLVWGGGDGQLADESAVFDVERAKWTVVPHSTPALCGHTLDVVDQQLYCFGGSDGVKLSNFVLAPQFDASLAGAASLIDKFLALCAAVSPQPSPMVKLTPAAPARADFALPPSRPIAASPRRGSAGSPTLHARSPRTGTPSSASPRSTVVSTSPAAAPAAALTQAPAWAIAIGLGAHGDALAREEIGEDVLRQLTVEHLEAIGVDDAHERFRVLQAIESRYGGGKSDAAAHLLLMQVQQASALTCRASWSLSAAES